jgi:hypothetical protein
VRRRGGRHEAGLGGQGMWSRRHLHLLSVDANEFRCIAASAPSIASRASGATRRLCRAETRSRSASSRAAMPRPRTKRCFNSTSEMGGSVVFELLRCLIPSCAYGRWAAVFHGSIYSWELANGRLWTFLFTMGMMAGMIMTLLPSRQFERSCLRWIAGNAEELVKGTRRNQMEPEEITSIADVLVKRESRSLVRSLSTVLVYRIE